MKRYTAMTLLITSLVLGGCATTSPQPVTVTINDPAMRELNVMASKAVATQEQLAAMQSAVKISQVTQSGLKTAAISDTAVPSGWGEKISLSYTGSYANLIESLCKQANYTYYGLKADSNPPIITVEGQNKPLIHYLRAGVAQLPDGYDVKLYAANRSVVVHHDK